MDEDLPSRKALAVGTVIGVVLAILLAFIGPAQDEVVIAAITEEVTERACISQAAIYERLPKPVCALGTRDVPATALSYPVARK